MKPSTAQNEDRITRILKRVRRIELITRGLVKETLGGAYHSRFKGQGIEFEDFRLYQPGDDVRFLDWNVTARLNEAYVRKYIEEREMTVLLMVDVSSSGDYGSGEDSKRERAAEMAAIFAFSALQNQDKAGLVMFTDELEFYLPAHKGAGQALRIVREILNYQPRRRRTALNPALELAVQRIPHRALVFVISDFLTPPTGPGKSFVWEGALRACAAKHDVVGIHLMDPREIELPHAGRVCLEDPETHRQVIVNTSNPEVRARFAERMQALRELTSATFERNSAGYIPVRTDTDYLPALKTWFRSRRR